jgi:hypothetical protein
MKASIVAGLVASASASAAPATPVWPSSFSVSFNETTSIIIASYNTSGVWYYDYANNRARMDRETGEQPWQSGHTRNRRRFV